MSRLRAWLRRIIAAIRRDEDEWVRLVAYLPTTRWGEP